MVENITNDAKSKGSNLAGARRNQKSKGKMTAPLL